MTVRGTPRRYIRRLNREQGGPRIGRARNLERCCDTCVAYSFKIITGPEPAENEGKCYRRLRATDEHHVIDWTRGDLVCEEWRAIPQEPA